MPRFLALSFFLRPAHLSQVCARVCASVCHWSFILFSNLFHTLPSDEAFHSSRAYVARSTSSHRLGEAACVLRILWRWLFLILGHYEVTPTSSPVLTMPARIMGTHINCQAPFVLLNKCCNLLASRGLRKDGAQDSPSAASGCAKHFWPFRVRDLCAHLWPWWQLWLAG